MRARASCCSNVRLRARRQASRPGHVASTHVNRRALTAELMAQPLDQFTTRRNARVKELKVSGQANLARELSSLKKPAVPLWAANQLRDRARFGGLRRAAQAGGKAQGGGATGGVRAGQGLGAGP